VKPVISERGVDQSGAADLPRDTRGTGEEECGVTSNTLSSSSSRIECIGMSSKLATKSILRVPQKRNTVVTDVGPFLEGIKLAGSGLQLVATSVRGWVSLVVRI
jgi:hypothetical protein